MSLRMRNQLIHVRRLTVSDLPLAKPLEMLRPPHTGYVMELLTGMAPIEWILLEPLERKVVRVVSANWWATAHPSSSGGGLASTP